MKKGLEFLDRAATALEIVVAVILLLVISIKILEIVYSVFVGHELIFIEMDIKEIMIAFFNLVIGLEFIKMLIKHTPESVIEVLMFIISRQMIMYHEESFALLIGVVAIAGLFAVKKYLIGLQKK